jgi:UTP--glucose-1-phosphate uridylyltransferase
MAITKAIITTAGFGTRFLPISKTIQKEMLPIVNRPLVDYVVDDLVKAGVTDIIFVVSEHNKQILHYYSENARLREYLEKMGKLDAYQSVSTLHSKARFTFVRQSDEDQYGTAVPVRLCREYLQDEEAFFVYMGDDFMYNSSGVSEAAEMKKLFELSGASGVATFIERPTELLHKYGVAEVEERNGIRYLKHLVEKPAPGTAPSNLCNISKYILTPAVFDILDTQQVNPESGELYVTDTVEELAHRTGVAVYTPKGEYLDGGFVESWLKANLRVAWDNPQLRQAITEYVAELSAKN